jgi:hypothetical protein
MVFNVAYKFHLHPKAKVLFGIWDTNFLENKLRGLVFKSLLDNKPQLYFRENPVFKFWNMMVIILMEIYRIDASFCFRDSHWIVVEASTTSV